MGKFVIGAISYYIVQHDETLPRLLSPDDCTSYALHAVTDGYRCYIHASTPYRWQEVDDVVYTSIGDALEAMSSRHKPYIKNGISKSELDNILMERGKLLKITL